MSKLRTWTQDDIKLLIETYCKGGRAAAAEALGRSEASVEAKFHRCKSSLAVPYALRRMAQGATGRGWDKKGNHP